MGDTYKYKEYFWASIAAVFTALMAFVGNLIVTYMSNTNDLVLEKEKLRSSLILKAIDTTSQEEAVKNLLWMIDVKLVDDSEGVLLEKLKESPGDTPFKRIEKKGIAPAAYIYAADQNLNYKLKSTKGNKVYALLYNVEGQPDVDVVKCMIDWDDGKGFVDVRIGNNKEWYYVEHEYDENIRLGLKLISYKCVNTLDKWSDIARDAIRLED